MTVDDHQRLQLEAFEAAQIGNHVKAEHILKASLQRKAADCGCDSVEYAMLAGVLGEEQIKLEKWKEAEKHLTHALQIHTAQHDDFDLSYLREELIKVYEGQGLLDKARQIRDVDGEGLVQCVCGKIIVGIPGNNTGVPTNAFAVQALIYAFDILIH
jgi:hypothetical protein